MNSTHQLFSLQWPQLLWLALAFIRLGVEIAKNGQTKTTKYSGWATLFALGISAFILWQGGFFRPLVP